MYDEKNSGFSLRNVILQFLFVALFIFVLIWLFPMKSDLEKMLEGVGSHDNPSVDLTMFYDQIFNNNVVSMKDAAKSYYTNERLPQKVGDKASMTLREMLEKNIILPFVDSKGKQCDLDASYVEVTKADNEYVLKVNLKCPEADQENYLLVYMGCYDYCTTAICEKNKTDVTTPVVKPSKPTVNETVNNIVNNITNNNTINNITNNNTTNNGSNPPDINIDIDINNNNNNENNNNNNNNGGGSVTPTPDPDPKPDPDPDPKPDEKYLYKYVKKTGGYYTEWGPWSSWDEDYITPTNTTQVEWRTVRNKYLTGYKVVTTKDLNQPIYGTKTFVTAKKTVTECVSYRLVSTGESSVNYGEYVYIGEQGFSSPRVNDGVYMYVPISQNSWSCEEKCSSGVQYFYKVYKRTATTSSGSQAYACEKEETHDSYITTTQRVIVDYVKVTEEQPVYRYETVKQYRSRTRKYIPSSSTDVKWSSSYNDQNLINQGYIYSGEYQVVKS